MLPFLLSELPINAEKMLVFLDKTAKNIFEYMKIRVII